MCNIPEQITPRELKEASVLLSRSERGCQAMSDILALLDNGGDGLDALGKVALLTLLIGSFGSFTGLAKDAMREAIGATS